MEKNANTERLNRKEWWPCIADYTGHARQKVSSKPMTYDDARQLLEDCFYDKWVMCEASVQHQDCHYFREGE